MNFKLQKNTQIIKGIQFYVVPFHVYESVWENFILKCSVIDPFNIRFG